jgi:hypothetical protein
VAKYRVFSVATRNRVSVRKPILIKYATLGAQCLRPKKTRQAIIKKIGISFAFVAILN